MRPRTLAAVLVVVVALAGLTAPWFRSYTRAAALIVGMTGIEGPVNDVWAFERGPYTVSDLMVPTRHGSLRARLFVPDRIRRAIVLVPGLHAVGIDEPRYYNLAMQFAQVGVAVLAPEMPDLARFSVTPRTTDMIEDAAVWLTRQPAIARDGRIGLVGISFAGGLSMVAAGRPALRDHLAFVFAFGGHANFPRVLRYLCSGEIPADPEAPPAERAASYLRPHDYGVAVLSLGLADRLVPAAQVEPLRAAILEYLAASCYDLINLNKALATYASAHTMAEALDEPARGIMTLVNARDVDTLGPRLLALLPAGGHATSLSAELSDPPTAPVYLLHGAGDNVVPASETRILARHLAGRARVRALLSGLITHAELNNENALAEGWALIRFFAALLRE